MQMNKRKGILRKSFVFAALLIAVTIVLSFTLLYLFLPTYYMNSKTSSLEKNTASLIAKIENAKNDQIEADINQFCLENNVQLWAYDGQGQTLPQYSSILAMEYLIGDNNSEVEVEIKSVDEKSGTQTNKDFLVEETQVSSQFISIRKEVKNNSSISYIDVIGNLQPIDEAVGVIISLLPILLVITLAIGLLFAYLFAKQFTRPILQLTKSAKQMQSRNADISSGIRSNDEIGELSITLDELYSELRTNIQLLEIQMEKTKNLEDTKAEFMRTAGHELKTPIAALTGILESMIENVGKYKDHNTYLIECKRITDNMARLIFDILKVSKLDVVDTNINFEQVNAAQLVEQLLDNYSIFITEKELQISLQIENLSVLTNENMLKVILSNLISNSVYYTPPKGHLSISVLSAPTTKIIIENEYENIQEDDLNKFFEPFYTQNESHTKGRSGGTGLGLYITKKNLEALNLSYTLEDVNGSIRFCIIF